jgi:dienelactone hydrolase
MAWISDLILNRQRWLVPACAALSMLLLSMHESAADQTFRILSPPGDTPHPAVLLVPGCSGFVANGGVNSYDEHAADLQAAGYVVVFVDYVGRRLQTNCANISLTEVGTDIMDAASWARTQSGIDGGRVFVIGWSYGSGGVLAALKAMPPQPLISKAVMYYPVCRGASPWSVDVVGLMLLGGKDDIASPTLCKPVVGGVAADRLTVITYPEARHGFDMRGVQGRADQPGAPVYNPEAAKASWATVLDFLKQQ